ncbi:MAG: selenocysteine-specific translation elongation factor [Burkholderiales bacterium]|nr:selenocysteine-specific translation elongation factor [Burkholderiales bacterium]
MIVGTAGHIDHGKTTLVRALTGVDTDRLPEEKKRGISIELGYAFLDVEDTPAGIRGIRGSSERIGFIDVPGHERLVHTMLAGATGIHFALLLVAADDGVMPQTREHLAVLSLLGLSQGAVVVTKADRVDAARLAAVCAEAEALREDSSLAGCPVLAVSAATGQGVADLKGLLRRAAAVRRGHDESGGAADDGRAFRLAVDRAFTLDGVGTVATGTVHAGRVRLGDELRLVPGERRVRVRSLRAQNREVPAGGSSGAGERCAIGLAGVAKEDVRRGQWLVAPAAALRALHDAGQVAQGGTTRLDARLTLWHQEMKPLRSGTVVHVHLGSEDRLGTVAVLDAGDSVAPGASALAQLVLREPLGAWAGDRVVLRDASATRTLAGGVVLDPMAPTRYRRTPERLAELAALERPEAGERAAALLVASPLGLDLGRFAAAQGLAEVPGAGAWPGGTLIDGDWALAAAHAEAARAALLQALAGYHAKHADELGPDAARLRRLALPRLAEPLYRALLGGLVQAGRVALRGAFVHLPEHGVRLSASEERIAQKVGPRLAVAGFEGAWARDLARDSGESEPLMRTTLARLAQRGELHQVVKDLYYPLETMATLAAIARAVGAKGDGVVTAASFRDATQLGRKRAIQVLEHFDRIGLTRRVGDVHRVRTDSTLFIAPADGGPPRA